MRERNIVDALCVRRDAYADELEFNVPCALCTTGTSVTVSSKWFFSFGAPFMAYWALRVRAREKCFECMCNVDWIAYPRDF